jgi:Flp pilus assembly protein TadG
MGQLLTKMRRVCRRVFSGRDSGQALVETALTMPVLLIMLVGAVELGRTAYTAIEVANSAKAAAQYGAQNPGTSVDTTTMQTLAVNEAKDYGITLNTPITVTPSCKCAKLGTTSADTCGSTSTCASTGGYLVTTLTISTSANFTPVFHIPGIGPSFTVYGGAVQEVLF